MKTASCFYSRALWFVGPGLISLVFLTFPIPGAASDKAEPLSIDGISSNMGEDEPRVLNILPWRAPTLPRRPRAELDNTAPELLKPLDPLVLERHRKFRQNLGVSNTVVRSGEWQ